MTTKMIARPQIDTVEAGRITVHVSHATPQNQIRHYTSQTNLPVNMSYVMTFFADNAKFKTEPALSYPTITFKLIDDKFQTWFYPPTNEGVQMRNSDLQHLHQVFCDTCPSTK